MLVTAELVEPMDNVGGEPLPGFMQKRPDDWQLFVDGRIEDSIVAPLPESQARAMRSLGLDKLKGPGAWRRFDDVVDPPRPDVGAPIFDATTQPASSDGAAMESSE